MYRLYQRFIERDTLFVVFLTILALVKELRYFFWLLATGQGIPKSPDSQWYIDYAQALIANLQDGIDMNDVLYMGYNVLLSLLLTIFKEPAVVVFIQAVTAGLSVILVYKIADKLFNRSTAIIASLFYCSAWDITLWATYVLSDSFFTSLLLLCVYYLLLAVELPHQKYKILFALTAVYLLLFRPTGIIMVSMMTVYVGICLGGKALGNYLMKYRTIIGAFVAVALAAGAYLASGSQLDPFFGSLQFNAKKVLYNIYAKGWVYDNPTSHDYFFRSDYQINICNSLVLSYIVNNWDHVMIVYTKRAVAFLGNWVWKTDLNSFSGIATLIGNLLPTLLFLVGTIAAVINGLFRRASIVWLIVLGVVAFCILVFIDAMYRYRLPAIPFIILVAAYGAERTLCATLRGYEKIYGDADVWKTKKP